MIRQGQNTSSGCLDNKEAAYLEGLGRLGAFEDAMIWIWAMAACVMVRMSPIGVQIEIGAVFAFTQDNNTASLALNCVVLNMESGHTLSRMMVFASSPRNECGVVHCWERITLE